MYIFIANFVDILDDHGIKFIGPTADHIRIMGDKITAKETMKALKVPCVPGSDGSVSSLEAALTVGQNIGYPLIVKATAGGGGRGMKVANNKDDLENAFLTARSEANSAFGNDEVYIERYLTNPRHIEIQVFGDGKGNAIHLGERDCSLQRRHQKVLEEAPGPSISSEVREYMPGDEIRTIDWNVTARYNEPFVKVFEEERELTLMLIVDVSGSELFGTDNALKKNIITEISATLAFSALQNNDKNL